MDGSQLAQFIKEEFYLPQLTSRTKDQVLEELLRPLVEKGNIKGHSLILETLKKRETLGSTGIGKGIAVPHCRTSVVSDVHIVIGVSQEGVSFESIDKKKVKLFFLIIAPPQEESNLYLPILGKVVEMVRNSRTRKALMKAKDFSSFLEIIQGG